MRLQLCLAAALSTTCHHYKYVASDNRSLQSIQHRSANVFHCGCSEALKAKLSARQTSQVTTSPQNMEYLKGCAPPPRHESIPRKLRVVQMYSVDHPCNHNPASSVKLVEISQLKYNLCQIHQACQLHDLMRKLDRVMNDKNFSAIQSTRAASKSQLLHTSIWTMTAQTYISRILSRRRLCSKTETD